MNSPYGGLDHLSDWSWYDPSLENTPSSDVDYILDDDAFSTSTADLSQFPDVWPSQSWANSTSAPPLSAPQQGWQHQQYDFSQQHQQQVWCVPNAQVDHGPPILHFAMHNINGRHDARLARIPCNGAIATPSPPVVDSLGITADDRCNYPRHTTVAGELDVTPEALQAFFPSPLLPRREPPNLHDDDGQPLQKQNPRFDGDLYTAMWIRGEGVSRVGWCGFCASWHKLKDSAYWYHLHYTHGIACSSGRPLERPRKLRWSRSTNGLEALCPNCEDWVPIGKGAKMKTAYWRHAYKCLSRGSMRSQQGRSPRRGVAVREL